MDVDFVGLFGEDVLDVGGDDLELFLEEFPFAFVIDHHGRN